MSLKVVRRPGSHNLYVRGTVRGQSIFESTETADPDRAEGYRIRRENELWDRSVYGARATTSFATAVGSYLAAEERSDKTKGYVSKLLLHFASTPLAEIGQEQLDAAYRALLPKGVSNATKIRAVLGPLQAIMRHAARRQWCALPAFEVPDVGKTDTAFLRPAEAVALTEAAADHLRPLLIFLIGTGARLSEALDMEWSAVDLHASRATVRQKQGDQRHIDLEPVVLTALRGLPHRAGHVFRPPIRAEKGRMVQPTRYRDTGREEGGQIKTAWAAACRRAGLPGEWREWISARGKAQRLFVPALTPHDCRHTWATWHRAIHRDPMLTRDRGGWSTIKMVERYAHLMPEAYVEDAKRWLAGRALSVQGAGKRKKNAA